MTSKYIHSFFLSLKQAKNSHSDHGGDAVFVAHDITRKAAALYEKIRGFVDYQDETQIKRRVIERIIKRKLRFGKKDSIGRSILEELVGIGYLPNNSVPESRALEIQHLVDYYLALSSVDSYNTEFKNWTIAMSAASIHEQLFDRSFDNASIDMFVSLLSDHLRFDVSLNENYKEKIFLVATHQVLLQSSKEEMYFALFKREQKMRLLQNDHTDASLYVLDFFKEAKAILSDRLVWTVTNKIKDLGVAVKLLNEAAREYEGSGEVAFQDKALLETSMKNFLTATYTKEETYVKKNGIRAVIYLLCTKLILAFLIEVPVDLWLAGEIAFLSLTINVLFHPLLLLAITRRPLGFSKLNTEHAVGKALGIVDGHVDQIYVKIKNESKYDLLYFFLYGLLYAVTFGVILGVLIALHFNFISILLFLGFLALVSYFGFRVRSHAMRFKVKTGKEGLISTLGNIFMLPIVRLGRFLSTKFSSINAIVFIMDFIIETPFKLVLKVFNDFLYFLRDKREDVF